MSFDPVAWAIGGGQALHSPEIARVFAHASTSGAEGIVDVEDLRVEALPVAGAAVRIQPGAALVRNGEAALGGETYVVRNGQAVDVSVAATGSSGGRSDLIVARVEDPYTQASPWQEPADPAVGPYVFPRVIPDVPSGTTRLQDVAGYETQSAVTLARIDLPASTGTVTGGMITDLREMALPRSKRSLHLGSITYGEVLTSSSFIDWPGDGVQVHVPEWATQAIVRIEFAVGIINVGGNSSTTGGANGDFRIRYGGAVTPGQGFNLNLTGQDARESLLIADSFALVHSPGRTETIVAQARKLGGAADLTTRHDTSYVVDIQFNEVPV